MGVLFPATARVSFRLVPWTPTRSRAVRWPVAALCAALLFTGSAPAGPHVTLLSSPHRFSLAAWEVEKLWERGAPLIRDALHSAEVAEAAPPGVLNGSTEVRRAHRGELEAVISRAVSRALVTEGLGLDLPWAREPVLLPPLSFALVEPPRVLIVAERGRIVVRQSELLRPDITLADAEALERRVDRLGVSSLTVPIGGLATYPAMVLENQPPGELVVAAAHEWVHAYLFFSPLGMAYWQGGFAREVNETAADMASREIGRRVAAELGIAPSAREASPGGDRLFRAMIRETRTEVDALLSSGRVEEAEAYMRERRDELAQAGFNVRKLNQAYFAFYGSYGDAAAGASRTPVRLARLRETAGSVGAFLKAVRTIVSPEDLARATGAAGPSAEDATIGRGS